MKGKISAAGELSIWRPGKRGDGSGYRYANCPIDESGPICGDWCSLFGEPYIEPNLDTDSNTLYTWLQLCHAQHSFSEFKDEREES